VSTEDEDVLIDDLFQQKYESFKKWIKEKGNVEFMYPCKIIETFEYFLGVIYLTSK